MGFVILQHGLTIAKTSFPFPFKRRPRRLGDLVALFPLLKGEGRAFNSRGGGVASMLAKLILYLRQNGLDCIT